MIIIEATREEILTVSIRLAHLHIGEKVRLNGRRTVYTVIKHGRHGADLVGPRGGQKSLVRNINSRVVRMISIAGLSAKADLITSIEVL